MILKMYSIKDIKSGIYHKPVFMPHVETAKRSCASAVNQPDTELGDYPEDFELMFIGEFDDESGEVMPAGKLQCVCNLYSLKKDPAQLEMFKQGKEGKNGKNNETISQSS